MSEAADPDKRHLEDLCESLRKDIRDSVAADEVGRAVNLVMDFARDFAPSRTNDALVLCAQFNHLRKAWRRREDINGYSDRRKALLYELLDLTDEMYEVAC